MAGVEQIRDRIVGDEVFGPLHRACRVLQVIVRMLEMLGELSRSATRSDLHFKRICLTAELRNRTVGGIRSKGRQSKGQKHGDQLRGSCNNPQHYNTYLNGVSIMYSAIEMQGFCFFCFFSCAPAVFINTWQDGSQVILEIIPSWFLIFLQQIVALYKSHFAYDFICVLLVWEIFFQMKGALYKIDDLCQLSYWSCPW